MPLKLRDELSNDPYYRRCCVSGSNSEKIDFHHNLIFAGRQVNEKWCILPLAKSIHDNIARNKEVCDWIMLNRGTDEELERYSKAVDLLRRREVLNNKYGVYNP